jgi:acyl carrier protein
LVAGVSGDEAYGGAEVPVRDAALLFQQHRAEEPSNGRNGRYVAHCRSLEVAQAFRKGFVMSRTETDSRNLAAVREIIKAESDMDPGDFSIDARLDDLGLSSVQKIRVFLRIESEFKVEIDEDKAIELTTVRDILALLGP